jgi:transcriptional regulator with XRE-family HTH domain
MNKYQNFGQLVKAKRESLGYSQSQLGKMVGITQQVVDSTEKTGGKNMRVCNAIRLCRVLNITPAALFGMFPNEN